MFQFTILDKRILPRFQVKSLLSYFLTESLAPHATNNSLLRDNYILLYLVLKI